MSIRQAAVGCRVDTLVKHLVGGVLLGALNVCLLALPEVHRPYHNCVVLIQHVSGYQRTTGAVGSLATRRRPTFQLTSRHGRWTTRIR